MRGLEGQGGGGKSGIFDWLKHPFQNAAKFALGTIQAGAELVLYKNVYQGAVDLIQAMPSLLDGGLTGGSYAGSISSILNSGKATSGGDYTSTSGSLSSSPGFKRIGMSQISSSS